MQWPEIITTPLGAAMLGAAVAGIAVAVYRWRLRAVRQRGSTAAAGETAKAAPAVQTPARGGAVGIGEPHPPAQTELADRLRRAAARLELLVSDGQAEG